MSEFFYNYQRRTAVLRDWHLLPSWVPNKGPPEIPLVCFSDLKKKTKYNKSSRMVYYFSLNFEWFCWTLNHIVEHPIILLNIQWPCFAKVARDRSLRAWKFPEGIEETKWGSGYPAGEGVWIIIFKFKYLIKRRLNITSLNKHFISINLS